MLIFMIIFMIILMIILMTTVRYWWVWATWPNLASALSFPLSILPQVMLVVVMMNFAFVLA